MARISLVPRVVDLVMYAGDGVQLRVNVQTPDEAPLPLDGAVEAQIRAARSDAAAAETFAVDLADASSGTVVLSLAGAQTGGLVNGTGDFAGFWDVEYTPTGAEPVTLVQGAVQCRQDVTR